MYKVGDQVLFQGQLGTVQAVSTVNGQAVYKIEFCQPRIVYLTDAQINPPAQQAPVRPGVPPQPR